MDFARAHCEVVKFPSGEYACRMQDLATANGSTPTWRGRIPIRGNGSGWQTGDALCQRDARITGRYPQTGLA